MKHTSVRSLQDERRRQQALDDYSILDSEAEQAFDDIARLAATICDAPVAMISLLDQDRQWFKARIGLAETQTPRVLAVCDHAIRDPHTVMEVRDLSADTRFSAQPPFRHGETPLRFYAGAPLLSPDGQPLGTVCVMDVQPRVLTQVQREALSLLARQTQHLLELRRFGLEQRALASEREDSARRMRHAQQDLQRRHDDLKHVARHDPLTGLLNRAAMEQLLVDPEAMAKLERAPYALLVLDIDHFKRVNDQYGHLLGDRALRAVGEAITGALRTNDVAIRYGGEEFIVVFPDSTLPAAFEVAERIRMQVAGADLPFTVSVSAGLAAGDPQHDRPREVFDRADQALYRAKASGRDRVVVDDSWRH